MSAEGSSLKQSMRSFLWDVCLAFGLRNNEGNSSGADSKRDSFVDSRKKSLATSGKNNSSWFASNAYFFMSTFELMVV
jgi:hypothetical protein